MSSDDPIGQAYDSLTRPLASLIEEWRERAKEECTERGQGWVGAQFAFEVCANDLEERAAVINRQPMTGFAHSPGPWRWLKDKSRTPRKLAMVTTPNGSQAIDCTDSGENFAQDEANARLIATAPEMYALLREIVADDIAQGVASDWTFRAKALLDKAE